ncbi:MAG: FecR domain-containing protein [Bacteroidota bacterium]
MKQQEIIKKRNNELVKKFSEGRCTPEEASEVVNWLKEPKFQSSLYGALSDIWHHNLNVENYPEEEILLQSTLDKVHHRINIVREHEVSHLQKRIRLNTILLRVAAIFILPLLTLSILYMQEKYNFLSKDLAYTEISVSKGSKLKTVLPDGTGVWLNSGSTLRYPQKYGKKNRITELSGEAYFDVVSNKSKPFLVQTGSIDIKVTGTKFNVMAYPEDDYVSATLEEGEISIEKADASGIVTQLCSLEPNERAVFQKKEETIGKRIVHTDQYTSWIDGRLIFRNNSLEYIINRLERWYNTEIQINGDGGVLQSPFTMTIEDETVEQVLEYLSIASGISYEVAPAQKLENGEISNTRYIIHNIK